MYGCWDILSGFRSSKAGFFETCNSESTAHCNDTNISYCEKLPKISENPLIIDLVFHQNLPFLQYAQNTKQFYISRLAILSWTNGTNNFVTACTVVEILLLALELNKICTWYQWMPNLSKEHITMATCTFEYLHTLA